MITITREQLNFSVSSLYWLITFCLSIWLINYLDEININENLLKITISLSSVIVLWFWIINKFENSICEDILNNNPNIQIIDTYENLFEWIQFKKIKHLILPYETIGNKIFDNTDFLKKLFYKGVNYQFIYY